MPSPFKIVPQNNTSVNATKEVAQPVAGKHILRSLRTGDPLPTPEDGECDADPEIVWPAEHAVDHNPMKNLK